MQDLPSCFLDRRHGLLTKETLLDHREFKNTSNSVGQSGIRKFDSARGVVVDFLRFGGGETE